MPPLHHHRGTKLDVQHVFELLRTLQTIQIAQLIDNRTHHDLVQMVSTVGQTQNTCHQNRFSHRGAFVRNCLQATHNFVIILHCTYTIERAMMHVLRDVHDMVANLCNLAHEFVVECTLVSVSVNESGKL